MKILQVNGGSRLVGHFNKRVEEFPSLLFFSHTNDDFVKAPTDAELNDFSTMTLSAGGLFNPEIIFVKMTFLEELLVEEGVDQNIETRRNPRSRFFLQR